MAIKLIGTSSGVEVDSDTDKHLLVATRAPAFGALGAYSMAAVTGLIVATGAANAIQFAMRWGDATRLALIESVEVAAVVTAAITTSVPYDLALFICRSFTASDSAGTAITLTGNNQKRRTSMGTSLVTDMRINSTLAAGLTAGTRTQDSQAAGRVIGASGTSVGTQFFGANPLPLYRCDLMSGSHPIVLAQNEGIEVVSPLAGPATGTLEIVVKLNWMEVAAF